MANTKDCFGCGVCAASCPKQIVSIALNKNGFYEPQITKLEECVNCGICLDVCAFAHNEDFPKKQEDTLSSPQKQPISWAAWSNDKEIRRRCSSGGIGFEIGKQLIEKGYQAVGCKYDTNEQRAEHFIATTVQEFTQSIGSKYIQSYTEQAFKQIKRNGQKYLVTGTPCQIDSFRRMTQRFHCEENFVLLDFFCHCVPSMWAWKSYTKMLKPKIGEITYASWRNKSRYGWHDSWAMGVEGDKSATHTDWHNSYDLQIKGEQCSHQSRMSQGDLFYKLFLGDICLGPQCQKHCKYKYNKSAADIRIGDLWGETYKDNQEGVSALIAFTDKGKKVVEELSEVTLIEHPFEIVAEGQMKKNAKQKALTPVFLFLLRQNVALNSLTFKTALFAQRLISKIKKIL